MRVLQILTDTADTISNLAALRHHQVLARHGLDVRTLAVAPGNGTLVPQVVPTMAPSARSIAAFTQLRRELRWPDVVMAVDRVPRAVRGRSAVPVVVVSGTGTRRSGLVEAARMEPNVRGIVVPAGDGVTSMDIGHIRTPHDPVLEPDHRSWAARRNAARAQLGFEADHLVVAALDGQKGNIAEIRIARHGTLVSIDEGPSGMGASEPLDVLVYAVDAVVPATSPRVDPPDCLAPLLVDLVTAGAVPVGWPQGLDDDLMAGCRTAMHSTMNQVSDDTSVVDDTLLELADDSELLSHLSSGATRTARQLCDPDKIYREWSGILSQALPSQT